MMPAHETYDVIVVGAGAGGMTAAAVAAAEGLRVLVIEKTAFVGGTTAWSDGMVWIPANPKMKDVGLSDSITDAVRYLSRHGAGACQCRPARSLPRARAGGGRLSRSQHGSAPPAGESLSGLLSGAVGRDIRRARAGAGRVRRHPARRAFRAAARAAAGAHAVRRDDGQPPRHPASAPGRKIVAFDPARGAARFGIRVAAATQSARHDAASRQRARGAALCLAAGAAGRDSLLRRC
ncbi:glycine/D-amino acid oxidase-like deaminating enzyme [Bradyrhizobium sp. i1.3.6]